MSSDPDCIRAVSHRCPFGKDVRNAPELCRMTSSVFGGIAARNFGHARVVLEKRIALGDEACAVAVYLNRSAAGNLEGIDSSPLAKPSLSNGPSRLCKTASRSGCINSGARWMSAAPPCRSPSGPPWMRWTPLSPAAQVRLLRVLQEGELERVGGRRTLAVDVRIVVVANCELERAAAEGGFRKNLSRRGQNSTLPISAENPRSRGRD